MTTLDSPSKPRLPWQPLAVSCLLLTGLVAAGSYAWKQKQDRQAAMPGTGSSESLKRLYAMLMEWAMEHDQSFPDVPGDAQANFRLILKDGTTLDESLFQSPDGFSTAYIAGRDGSSDSTRLLLVSAPFDALPWITGQTQTPPARIYRGPVFATNVNGSAKFYETDAGGRVTFTSGGRKVDLFSAEMGNAPSMVRLPSKAPSASR